MKQSETECTIIALRTIISIGTDRPIMKTSYSNILRILPPKNENLSMKSSGSFHISAQNIDCGYLLGTVGYSPQCGGSNRYPQSMF